MASGIDRHPDRTEIDFRLQIQVIESSSLVPVLFREVFSHPYIFFHLLVYIYMFVVKKKIESYFSDRLTFSNIRSRTSRRIYRLVLALLSLETLSSLSK